MSQPGAACRYAGNGPLAVEQLLYLLQRPRMVSCKAGIEYRAQHSGSKGAPEITGKKV